MVNGDAAVVRLDALGHLPHAETDEVFVRPDGDLKDFAGEVTTFGALKGWAARLRGGDVTLDGSLFVAVARPKRLDAEWRVFAAEGPRIITATRYRLDGRLAPEPGAPAAVLGFAADRLRDWMPAPLVALDIAATAGGLGILELSDFQSAGHYAADIEAIVVHGSDVASRHWQRSASDT